MTSQRAAITQARGRVDALDGIRAIAVALVVIYHMHLGVSGGLVGVDIFFVLSGYLITTLLLREVEKSHRIAFKRFYVRRLIRLMPPLTLMVVAVALAAIATRTEESRFGWAIFGALTYLTPVTRQFLRPDVIFDHTWTLGYEEYFYLVWPALLVVLLVTRRWTQRQLGWVLAVGAAVVYGGYAAFYAAGHEFSFLRVAGIVAGSSMALLWRPKGSQRSRDWALAAVALLMLAGSVVSGRAPALLPLTVSLSAGSALLLVRCSVQNRPVWLERSLSFRPLRSIGTVSYEIYLWQTPVLLMASRLGIYGHAGRGLTNLGAAAAILMLAYGSRAALAPLQSSWRRAAAGSAPRGAPRHSTINPGTATPLSYAAQETDGE